MTLQNRFCFSLLLICSFFSLPLAAQRASFKIPVALSWKKPCTIAFDENFSLSALCFEGAHYDHNNAFLPFYYKTVGSPFGDHIKSIHAVLSDEVYEMLSDEEAALASGILIESNPVVKTGVSFERKRAFADVTIIPFRKRPDGKVEKLISFTVEIFPLEFYPEYSNQSGRYYAPVSVLATGTWFKVAVKETGIHKMDYNFLRQLGLNVDGMDPRKLRVYGNGGGMLPEYNADLRPDDLVENAIEVIGENDGVFNAGDYVLFYAEGPDSWTFSSSDNRYHHSKHLYSDYNYYFISTDLPGNGKRVLTQSTLNASPSDLQVNSYDYLAFHESNNKNFIKSGRNFYGEVFDASLQQGFTFPVPDLDLAQPVYFNVSVIAHSFTISNFKVNYNSQQLCSMNIDPVGTSYIADYARSAQCGGTFTASGSSITFNLVYNQPQPSSVGYLDYIEINARRKISLAGGQFVFSDRSAVSPVNNANYQVTGYNNTVRVWDVTDKYTPASQIVFPAGNFVLPAIQQRTFVVFRNSDARTPVSVGAVENQNLHGLPQTDLVIISHPLFMSQAERLAAFHREQDNLRVVVADINKVYNEFSSGTRDMVAIRDFVKMFYDRSATDIPRYLLLFGDGSYINKEDYPGNSNFLPTYQSENSLSLLNSYTSDDFYGLLDSLEGNWTPSSNQKLDIGVGRMPVKNQNEAKDMVDKIMRYVLPGTVADATACSSANSSLGDWRNVICLIADDEDSSQHLDQTDSLLRNLNPIINKFNVDKIYLDAYRQQSTPGGQRYPDVNEAINNRVQKGALLVNFVGHGGELGWAHERILDISTINAWSNKYSMPLFLTATCEFSRWDDPARTSAGEYVYLNANGGGIALFSTTRLVYSFPNAVLNKDMMINMFEPINGEMPRLGDIFRLSKRDNSGAGVNPRNFTLLGDPALRLSYPKYDVVTTQINNHPVAGIADTVQALSRMTIHGEVHANGQKLTGFNGVIYPVVFDKSQQIKTLSNDASSPPRVFSLRKNILFKGKASVVNGDFSFSFIIPKDISYNYGTGRLSYYAQNGAEDASGYYEDFIIGGLNENAVQDNQGPVVSLYLNNEKFVSGSITSQNPKIYATVSDSSGINTVGNGIGHDIVAVLDGKNDPVIVLNDYYESELDNFQKGKIIYSLKNLSEGPHSLKLKVWDIFNNSSDAYTEFIVANSSEIALEHVLNYPNPFSTKTTFFFEHNQPCEGLKVQVQIFTVSGKLIKTIEKQVYCEGFRSDSVEWNGTDDEGDKIGRGVYIYRLRLLTQTGLSAEKYEKLVLLR